MGACRKRDVFRVLGGDVSAATGNGQLAIGAAVISAALAGCASGEFLRPPAKTAMIAQDAPAGGRRAPCPPVPAHVTRAASARATGAGETMIGDIEKARALRDLIAIYEHCRTPR